MTAAGTGQIYHHGEVIVRQGESGQGMCVIQEGQVEVVHQRDGEEVRLTVLGERDFFGEVPLFERVRDGGKARATIRALGDVRVLRVDRQTIAERIHQDPALALRILETMSRRIQELEPAFWTTYLIALMSDLDELLAVIIDEATQMTEATSCSLALYDQEADELYFRVAGGEEERSFERRLKLVKVPMGAGALGWCAQHRQPVRIDDAYADERFNREVDKLTGFVTRAILAVPLVRKDRLIGVIEAVNKKGNAPFSERDEQLLTVLASQAALVLENARLYEENLRQVRLSALGQGIAGAAHCIKNILNGMEGGGYIVDVGLKRRDMGKIAQGWDILGRNSAIMKNLVLDMLAYSRPREPECGPCDINEICANVASLVEEKAGEKGLRIVLDLQPDIGEAVLDHQGVYRTVLNLVSNAVDATDKGTVTITTRVSQEHEQLRIDIADTGCGISEESIPKLFRIFYSTKGHKGTGLGLAVSHKIVEEQGGTIGVASEVGVGTTFTITLPMRPAHAKERAALDA